MRFYLLLLFAVVVPSVWGWVVYSLMQRLWPMPEGHPGAGPPADPPSDPASSLSDFQI